MFGIKTSFPQALADAQMEYWDGIWDGTSPIFMATGRGIVGAAPASLTGSSTASTGALAGPAKAVAPKRGASPGRLGRGIPFSALAGPGNALRQGRAGGAQEVAACRR
ncbi:unnamed protein product [Prorocentrum cordatum]|uniref:Uncharacterized protein n=1 Tax=Prorocentrum cordatum TaxID=2364126 RepID=A0ABN9V280_9DINO|nr:unnamed protein product [Polarella glacialis]